MTNISLNNNTTQGFNVDDSNHRPSCSIILSFSSNEAYDGRIYLVHVANQFNLIRMINNESIVTMLFSFLLTKYALE